VCGVASLKLLTQSALRTAAERAEEPHWINQIIVILGSRAGTVDR
jgi:hypothetical protein